MKKRDTTPIAEPQISAKTAEVEFVDLDRPKLPIRRRDNPWLRRAMVFITCVLVVDALFGDRGLAETLRARREYRAAAEALAQIRNENAALREQRRRLVDDPGAIEAVARQDLGLIRPGEILVVIRDVR